MQLSLQLKAVHEFQDLKETMVRMKSEADLLFEDLRKEIDLRSRAHTANIMGKRENAHQRLWTKVDEIHSAFH